tara:strand:- start:533 stop:760 length:228 start_codon:yes stop_codon:yes gene_type:complete
MADVNSTQKAISEDFERTKEYALEIKNNIPKFTKKIEYICKNIDLCNVDEIQNTFAYLIVGFRLAKLDLDEIRKS